MSEAAYLQLLRTVRNNPDSVHEGRNGKVYSMFDAKIRYFDVANQFPLFTSKFVHFHSLMVELLWFLKGDTNIKFLHDHNVKIWDEWADEDGNLGPIYGAQWRKWPTGVYKHTLVEKEDGKKGYVSSQIFIDQIQRLMDGLVKDPFGRRHIVSAWNPAEVDKMALPPCHCFFQCYVDMNDRLHLKLYQRSADMFLGVPFNVASYSLLLILLAHHTGYTPGDFIHDFGDVHIYDTHMNAVDQLLSRKPTHIFPKVEINYKDSIFDYEPSDFKLIDYGHAGKISAPVSK